nr:helix-turn-helix transcriptional regulator [Mangrovicoccus ximenensis]
MSRSALTGTRIRERRTLLGMKQAELARAVEISPSYLNLIEHNRRRIAGKLLGEIARELHVEVAQLTRGAEAELLDLLGQAAADLPQAGAELDRGDEFVGRFPGWAAVVQAQHRRIQDLQDRIEGLSDRLSHDPRLSSAMHEVLSKATAIRSAATILVETEDIDEAWRRRFHRNLHGDSLALAESAQALTSFLDGEDEARTEAGTPWEELELFLESQRFHFPVLEEGGAAEAVLAEATELTAPARELARHYLERYRREAAMLPLAALPHRARRGALDQPAGQLDPPRQEGGVVEMVAQQVDRHGTDLAHRDGDRAELGVEEIALRQPVHAHHRDLPRHRHAHFAQRHQRADRQAVPGREDRGEIGAAGGDMAAQCLYRRFRRPVGGIKHQIAPALAQHRQHLVAPAIHPPRDCAPPRPRQEQDALMAEAAQVARRQRRRRAVVRHHARQPHGRVLAIDQHDRLGEIADRLQQLLVVDGQEQHARDRRIGKRLAEHLPLFLRTADRPRVERHPERRRPRAQPFEHMGGELVALVVDHRMGAGRDDHRRALEIRCGAVVQRLGRGLHLGADLGPDPRRAGQRTGDRAGRDAALGRQVAEADFLGRVVHRDPRSGGTRLQKTFIWCNLSKYCTVPPLPQAKRPAARRPAALPAAPATAPPLARMAQIGR